MSVATPTAPTRRGVEATLLVFAIVLAMAAYAAVGLAVDNELPPDLLTYGAGLGALVLVAHLVVRRVAPYADPLLLPAVTALNGLGLVLIYRLDLSEAERARQNGRAAPSEDVQLQLAWTAVGIALFVLVLIVVRNHRSLGRYAYTAMFVGIGLLALPALLPARFSEVNGARIWIRAFGFSIQPGEFAKLLLIIFFAGYLMAKRDVLALASRRVLGIDLPRGRDLGPILVAWAASLLILVRERDLGTSLLFFGVFVILLYIATERLSWLLFGLILFVTGALGSYAFFGHVARRVDIWLDPWPYYNKIGGSGQLLEGLFGLATGGILGTGLGQGRPERVPYAKTDFIMATIGEELGLTGVMAVLIIYAIVVERGLRTALAVRDPFGKLLAAGLATSLALQLFVVVGGVTRLVPLTGLTTPFLSYGGSSLVANWALVALLLRISNAARAPAPIPAPAVAEAPTQVMKQ